MAAQFGWAPLVSLPDPALGTGATSTRPLPQTLRNMRLGGMLSRSLAGA